MIVNSKHPLKIPHNDASRLKKLSRYDILDTPAETYFNTIALMAAEIFDTSGALVTFVDKDRVFFKANVSSLLVNEIKREDSLCSLTVLNDEVTVFCDTHDTPDLLLSPYVSAEGGIRFYAGAPITTMEGYNIGTVCVIDDQPRSEVTVKQLKLLKLLSTLTLEKLESRLSERNSAHAYDDNIHRLVHDMKNPITSIIGYSQLINEEENSPEMLSEYAGKIEMVSKGMEQNLNNLLCDAKSEHAAIDLNLESVSVSELLDYLKSSFEIALKNKGQRLIIHCDEEACCKIDRQRIQDALGNLLSNSIKYSHLNSDIHVNCSSAGDEILFEFKDFGVGLTEEDLKKLFVKFARLSSVPTAHERSNGLGLSIVKMLVQLHAGKVWATSAGKNKGSSFFIMFPKS
ncbi:GAF domain-containing sensor histidine kinase [Daejeonella sp.]|uniref:GAF domain-containing sensor histidine kinase n=1 Tax=Daejeonella sp. TaxID=2805397 RepID=UPI0030C004D2